MMAAAGGAMRATGWRATAIRFQQFGEGGSYGIARLRGRRARGQRRACEIDLRGARPAPAACAALCVAMDGGWQPTSMVCWCRSAARIRRRCAGDAPAMMVVTRRGATNTTLAATQRHPCRCGMATADCAWSRSRPESVVASGGTEGSAENSRVNLIAHPFARARR